MIARGTRAILILPLFGFILYLYHFYGALSSAPATARVVFGVLLASNAVFLSPRWGPRLAEVVLLVATVVGLLGLLPLLAPSFVGPNLTLSDALLGVWLALPFLAIGVLILSEASVDELVFTFQAALADAVIIVGALQIVAASGGSYTGESVVKAYSNEIAAQLRAWLELLTGKSVSTLPLQSIEPLALLVLAWIAFVGVLLPMLEPPDVLRQRMPQPVTSMSEPGALAVSDWMEEVLATASSPSRPPSRQAPGLAPLITGGIAALVTEVVASLAWNLLLPGLVAATVVIVVGAWVAASSTRVATTLPRPEARTEVDPRKSTARV